MIAVVDLKLNDKGEVLSIEILEQLDKKPIIASRPIGFKQFN